MPAPSPDDTPTAPAAETATPLASVAEPPEVNGDGGEEATVFRADGRKSVCRSSAVQPFSCGHSAFLTSAQLRQLRLGYEEWLRSLAGHLSGYLRLDCTLRLEKLQTVSAQKFIDLLESPTHLTLFKVEPWRGLSVLDFSPRLGLAAVDRLMGGDGEPCRENRELSEMEVALLDQVLQVILVEWCRHWRKAGELWPVVLGHETSGRYLQFDTRDQVLLACTIDTVFGRTRDRFQLALPLPALETLIHQLQSQWPSDTPADEPSAAPAAQWNRVFDDVTLPVKAWLGGLQLTARDVAGLREGSLLQFGADSLTQVVVSLEQQPKFFGRLGTQGKSWAVELARPFKT